MAGSGKLRIGIAGKRGLAFVSGYAFVATLRRPKWLWPAQGATWLAIAAIAWFYWPK